MNVLVTGHLGFIGPVVIRKLRQAGHKSRGLDVGYFKENLLPNTQVDRPDEELISDIRILPSNVFDGIDAVIHLAAISNDPMGELNPSVTDKINFQASIDLAKKAKEAGVKRFIFSSST